jgi:phage tail sheath protein FI
VRTITGVSTSITAFVGAAKQGPLNQAVRIFGYGDYERRFGGLDAGSEMSYAVRQFFANGGSEALVVRVAKGVTIAKRTLKSTGGNGVDVLALEALDQGKRGNLVEVRVDHRTANPASTFNVTLRMDPDGPGAVVETFANLSMNPSDPRYVLDVVNGTSELVRLAVKDAPLGAAGSSRSGELDGAVNLDGHNQLRVAVDGAAPVNLTLAGPPWDLALAALVPAITSAINAAGLSGKVGVTAQGKTLLLTSATTPVTSASSVRVLPGLTDDASRLLKLGVSNGGVETDAAAALRPRESPARSALTGRAINAAALAAAPASARNLRIALDGGRPRTVAVRAASTALPTALTEVAALVEEAVRSVDPLDPGFRGFTCRAIPAAAPTSLVLGSGTAGARSFVAVTKAVDDLGEVLGLLDPPAPATQPTDERLDGGWEETYRDDEAYDLIIGNRSEREGIYALESVDLFNLLCLPGVSDAGILADAAAYCTERRAFFIVDAPKMSGTPDGMLTAATGPALPKTDRAAVYYPWIKIADPLNGGKPRPCPPSGTMAGLYARTDSARGVWKAPAGTDAPLVGVQGVAYPLTDGENGLLNPRGVNCIRVFPVYGAVAWGARTLFGDDQRGSEWKYVPVRRTALFLEESLYRGLKWVVFEPNDEPLWGQIRLDAGAFMHNLFRQGAFQGTTPREAYFVKCDRETTTQNDIDLGIVNIVVGFAPLKPAEFVIVKLQQMAGQIQT